MDNWTDYTDNLTTEDADALAALAETEVEVAIPEEVAPEEEEDAEPSYGCRGCGSPVWTPNASCGCPMS
jgi:hypothetical protein